MIFREYKGILIFLQLALEESDGLTSENGAESRSLLFWLIFLIFN